MKQLLVFLVVVTAVCARGTGNIFSEDQSTYLHSNDTINIDICDDCGEITLYIVPTFYNLTDHPAISVSCYSDGTMLGLQQNDNHGTFMDGVYGTEIICTKDCEISYQNCGYPHGINCTITTNNDVLVAYNFIAMKSCALGQYIMVILILFLILSCIMLACFIPASFCCLIVFGKPVESEEGAKEEGEDTPLKSIV